MRLGVISDIHSNYIAFTECLKRLESEGCEEYLFLGDYISDTSYTRETLDFLYEFIGTHTCHLLRGNREEYMLSQREDLKSGTEDKKWIYNSASGNLLYSYELLSEKDFEFLDSLPITFVYEKKGYPSIRCCHGSPESSRELIQLGSDRARFWLDNISEDYLLCAHTHFPGEYEYHGKLYMNSGCVGIAINDAGYAQCMKLDSDTSESGEIIWKPAFLKVPYDNRKVVKDMISAGLLDKAHWFINSNIQILLTGVDNSASMVELAAKLSEEAGETKGWPLIKEEYFEGAARRLGIPDYLTEDIR
ncbi:MAG: metallophosphoesterase [Lachnospiraceae bacterium]|nr:metallophosphoesterase [Lachnospiraceae bacterium]